MLELHVDNEGIEALCCGLARDFNEGTVKGVMGGFVQEVICQFLSESCDGRGDVFECVAVPTGRAGIARLRIRFSGAFYAYAARAAKDRYGLFSH